MTRHPIPIRLFLSAILPALLLTFLGACATTKDLDSTRGEVASVQGDLVGLESTVVKRQMALGEELTALRDSLSAQEARDEEFRQSLLQIQRRMNVQKIETNENFKHLTSLNLEYQKTVNENLRRLSDRIQDLDISLGELNQRLKEINALEDDQNRRLGETASRLNIYVEEADLEHGRLKQGLTEISRDYNKLADRINLLQKKLAEAQARAQASAADHHVVASGESLSSIASQHGTTVEALVRLNRLSNPNSISVGQKILLP